MRRFARRRRNRVLSKPDLRGRENQRWLEVVSTFVGYEPEVHSERAVTAAVMEELQ